MGYCSSLKPSNDIKPPVCDGRILILHGSQAVKPMLVPSNKNQQRQATSLRNAGSVFFWLPRVMENSRV